MISAIRTRPRPRPLTLAALPPLPAASAADSQEISLDEEPSPPSSLPPLPVNRAPLPFHLDPRSGVFTKPDPRPFAEQRRS